MDLAFDSRRMGVQVIGSTQIPYTVDGTDFAKVIHAAMSARLLQTRDFSVTRNGRRASMLVSGISAGWKLQ
jgi:hypothetical protein